MSQEPAPRIHSVETIRRLKAAALPSHEENLHPPDEIHRDLNRRDALRLLIGASSALGLGIAGCERKPRRQIVSRASGPEYQKPGRALHYSSTWMDGPYPYGLMIKTVDGRPIKIEGNPDHPVNRGTTTAAAQASVLSLYDPDRLRTPQDSAGAVTWDEADARVVDALRGATNVVLLTRSNLGPSEQALIAQFLKACPAARHFVHETVHDDPRRAAWSRVYNTPGEPMARFDRARVILSLDSDFLDNDGPVLENIRAFLAGRTLRDEEHKAAEMNRLYVVESALTVTGSSADHRVRLRPSAIGPLARVLLKAIDGELDALQAFGREQAIDAQLLVALADDLKAHVGQALVVAGPHLPEEVHCAVAILNQKIQAPGKTLEWNRSPADLPVSKRADIEAAFKASVDVAIFLDVNPVYDWPGGGFSSLLDNVRLSVGHGLLRNETLAACSLALPGTHGLESWNDAQPRDGVRSICQPVIAPLFDGRQTAESLLTWTRSISGEDAAVDESDDWHGYLKSRWVTDQVVAGSPESEKAESEKAESIASGFGKRYCAVGGHVPNGRCAVVSPSRLLMVPRNFPSAGDGGRFRIGDPTAPRGCTMVGLPTMGGCRSCPIRSANWSGTTRQRSVRRLHDRLQVSEGDRVAVAVGDRAVELPVLVQPGTADGVVVDLAGPRANDWRADP